MSEVPERKSQGVQSIIVRLVHAIFAPSVTGESRVGIHEDDFLSVGIVLVDRFGDVTKHRVLNPRLCHSAVFVELSLAMAGLSLYGWYRSEGCIF